MIVRRPIKAPLECFALGYDPRDPICIACRYHDPCRSLVKNPDKVGLLDVKFDLIPDSARIRKSADVGESVAAVYARAFRKVFGLRAEPDKPKPDAQEVIKRKAAEHGCTVENFCLIPMIVRKQAGEGFSARMLTGNYADVAVDEYFNALVEDHRRIDLEVIQELTGVNVKDRDFVTRFVKAEIVFGNAVINAFERGEQSKKWIVASCFEKADPIWQAVYQTDFELSPSAKRFRIAFRKKPSIAAQAFLAWQTAMPTAALRVLMSRGLSLEDFDSNKAVYDDTFQFWAALGYVFQHWRALSIIRRSSI